MKPFQGVRAEQNAALSDEDVKWLDSLPLMLRHDNFVVVHAGLEPAYSLAGQSVSVLRVRYVNDKGQMVPFEQGKLEQPANTSYWSEHWHGPESVVYGHAVHDLTLPRVDRFDGGACYGIDTGCVFGGNLTALVLEDGRDPSFVQVRAHQVYHPQTSPRE